MCKILNRLKIITIGCIFALGITVMAAEAPVLLESHTNDESFSVYVKGVDGDGDVAVQIATSNAEKVEATRLSDLDMPMQTLIMVDNSISIPTSDRDKITSLIQDLIADRLPNEEIAIATFSESVDKLTDYTNDYSTLKKALDSIEYKDQETYLTDVLYDLISSEYVNSTEDVYQRIIVISDGVDNKSLGYTKEELTALLKEYPIPIYTIGCSTGKNNTELENMFAISRSTSVDYFLLDDVEDTLEITDSLHEDINIMKLIVTPSSDIMDGGKKAVKITFGEGTSISTEIVMPQKVVEAVPESTIEEAVEETMVSEVDSETEIETESEIEKEGGFDSLILIVIVLAVILVLIIIAVVVIIIVNGKNKNTEFEQVDENILNQLGRENFRQESRTELVDSFRNADNGNTVAILDQRANYQLTLTDVNSPARSFYVPLSKSVVIGRRAESSDIVLDYDNTVSGRHCEISTRNGKFYVRDLQSGNGTYLNGSRVLTETEIFSGNILKLGRLEMRFDVR
jgi:type II secretory pathway pseudopilin PulG